MLHDRETLSISLHRSAILVTRPEYGGDSNDDNDRVGGPQRLLRREFSVEQVVFWGDVDTVAVSQVRGTIVPTNVHALYNEERL